MVRAGKALLAAAAAIAAGLPTAQAAVAGAAVDTGASANPIRRVVSLLQQMQAKVTAEGKKEEELYEKFECYCKKGKGELQASISSAETQISQDTSSLDQAEALKVQLQKELSQHQTDRSEAKAAVDQAKAMRAKEAAAFNKESSDYKTNVAALTKAINAIESGASGTFLQTPAASKLRRLTIDMDISSADRDMLSSFLSIGAAQQLGYIPKSAEITGILKEMKDTMEKELADITAAEQSAVTDFQALVGAKEKEIAANSEAIESKTARLGQTGVEIVQLKEDLDDTTLALRDDRQFLQDMDSSCATKTAEWEERSKVRADELVALAETIKILNDDEALELFKRTLPSPTLLQTQFSGRVLKHRAIDALKGKLGRVADPRMRAILLALSGRSSGTFDKVLKMIDNMTSLLKREQQDDDSKKEYCEMTIDRTEDEHKALERQHENLEKAIDEAKTGIDTLAEEISALAAGIRALDKSVQEATEIRKAEHAEHQETMAADQAAKELIGVAKNRLAKFYSPATYKAPPKRELSEQDRIFVNMGGTAPPTEAPGGIADTGVENPAMLVQVRAHRAGARGSEAPAPPPETWGAYQTKGQESNGVMAMLDLLLKDLTKEMTEMDVQEKESQREYEAFMADSSSKRAADAKLLSDRESAKAELEVDLQRLSGEAHDTLKSGMAKAEFLKDVHAECDWLMANHEARREARDGELDSLKNAKAILSGADFSFVQKAQKTANRLRGGA